MEKNWEENDMPSTSKTKTLRLNQFVGSDKPKMDDFNYDNTQLETLVGGHLDDTEKHLTQAEREEWSRPSSELYFYDGNDASQRSFTLDFEPRFCTVYALEMPPSVNDMSTPSVSLCYHAAAGQDGKATVGIALSGKTLTVYNDPDLSMAQTRRKLNAQGISYVCQLFR